MKILILSDAHDNAANTIKAIAQAEALGAEALIFCGDFCSPGTGIAMSKFKGPVYATFGNNDGDKLNLVRLTTAGRSDVTFFQEGEAQIELGGRRIAFTHYPKYAIPLAKTGEYDLVCFGHDHEARIETYGTCLAVNPGTLNPNPFRANACVGFALYDCETHEARLYELA